MSFVLCIIAFAENIKGGITNMNDEVYYGRAVINAEEEIMLDYYLIRESISEDYCDLIRYGVKVVKTVGYGGGGKTVESKQINNIFYREDEADGFLQLIMRNKVTPVSLMDVVEDYIIASIQETA